MMSTTKGQVRLHKRIKFLQPAVNIMQTFYELVFHGMNKRNNAIDQLAGRYTNLFLAIKFSSCKFQNSLRP